MISNKRILHIARFDTLVKKPSVSYYSCDKKISLGFLKNNNIVREFCYNDILRMNSLLGSRKSFKGKGLKLLLNTIDIFDPEIIVLGHVDIPTDIMSTIRKNRPNTKIMCWNVDAPSLPVMSRYKRIGAFIDVLFITSGGETLAKLKKSFPQIPKFCFFPNPVDKSVEFLKAYSREDYKFDVMYCGSESRLKDVTKRTNRSDFLTKTMRMTPNLNWFVAGCLNQPTIFGAKHYEIMGNTRFGINLSQFYPNSFHLYSSDRIARLIGNGLLTFNQEFPGLNKLLDFEEKTSFKSPEDLAKKLNFFKNNPSEAKQLAQKNSEKYHTLYSSQEICQYFLDTLYDENLDKYAWSDEVYT
ncbi:hypothetical protein IMCC14465_01150 [alpha proteobacterium IMCC14465]|uniref:Spore protein YkvP/CgeB glycosyl transferase-like domain-containing protein n=1 Tax=alpha proteobacterium IMCC14465 TaxID=1220535 RepID=J9DII9_9PROT|nr:hypothetical protein IMCC14465_01150 [alpha proteobacterium IMCC14465]